MDSKMRDHVIDELLKIPEVREISEVTGRFDIIATMYARILTRCTGSYQSVSAGFRASSVRRAS